MWTVGVAVCVVDIASFVAVSGLPRVRRPQPNLPRDVSIGGGVRGDLQYEQGELLCAAPVEAARAQETGWPLLRLF